MQRQLFLTIFFLSLLTPAAARPAEIALSLRQAVDIALAPDGNTRVALAAELAEQASATANQSRAALLPQVNAMVSQQSVVRNLEAFGIRVQAPIPGFELPRIVGPFDVFDARLTASQSIFDFSAIRRYQAAKSGASALRADARSEREAVTADVARAYLAALRAQERVATAAADVALAERLAELALNQKNAGVATGIEVTRAEVQLASERQRLLVRRQELRAAQLRLTRLIGLDLTAELRLSSALEPAPGEPKPIDQAFQEALERRADWQAQQRRLVTARRSDSSVRWERLPSVQAFADYGSIGSSVNNAQPTRTYGASVDVPLFNGGRLKARRSESASRLRQEELRAADLRRQIELELRLAADSLRSTAEQLEVAEQGRRLAENEFEQAERRYRAGVGGSIEITEAQTRLAQARQNQIDALFALNLARVDWSEARGRVEALIP